MNKGSETNKSKDNSSGAANSGNNKINILSIRKRTIRVIPTLALIKTRPISAPTADRMVNSQLNALKISR